MGGVEGAKFANHHVHVLLHVAGAHPGVGVGLARVGILGNGDGRNPFGDGYVLGVGVLDELGEPGFEVEAVVEYQVGGVRLLQVGGGGLVLVNLRTGFGEGFNVQVVTGDVAGDVGEHGEGGEHGLLAVRVFGAGATAAGQGREQDERKHDAEYPNEAVGGATGQGESVHEASFVGSHCLGVWGLPCFGGI